MQTRIFDGRFTAQQIEESLTSRVARITGQRGHAPKLSTVIVGDDPASVAFIAIKEKRARSIGMEFVRKHYPESFDPTEVVKYIHTQNEDKTVDGIIVQLPLPTQFDRLLTLKAIHPYKDVDGLHPKNLGYLIEGKPFFNPPAVLSVKEVLSQMDIEVTGKHVVLVGSGLLVGKPLALFFVDEGATVSMCSVHTPDIAVFTREADIIVASTGEADLINADMIKEGAVVIDFGGKKVGDELKGEFTQDVVSKAGVVTPVPGGVGPLVVSKLLENTVLSAERSTFGNNDA
ncbi:bifunctional 5,10-methylenetetrahydrofolate dehydrogenase/5,10-methenyltetrahydrofolate cyclohydrolase [candidate division WWE3 bacterium]|uniref:Bifunctional protein FolD n=1 Tax=candidate division WWE3 bacterium TaxID=2053526 RepID=A0A955LHH4_UNCKA|nr:bifunctional 5,10-methylenetetrahydrofolate dehydrogenase/5,10-methenyltetrahydrofolate cyclohydrolase [candidate division WWE3 bacterium]